MAYSASDPTVMPAEFQSVEKVDGVPYGSLDNRVFDSRCPPLVTPDTIIIAVCGPNDWSDNASPKADGCSCSGFFL